VGEVNESIMEIAKLPAPSYQQWFRSEQWLKYM